MLIGLGGNLEVGQVSVGDTSPVARTGGRNVLWVLDGQYYCVVLAVSQIDGNPGLVTVADGEGDAVGVMEAPHPDARKFRARPLQAVNLGNAVRYCPHASDRAAGNA
jgi:hypothetical protein